MKIVLVSPNKYCLNHNLTKDKIYEIISYGPHIIILNDLGYETEIPIHCFDTLKRVRKQKLKKINGTI
jgi:hypothetical protein